MRCINFEIYRDKLVEIGTFLEFDTRTEQKVTDGSKMDAVWEIKVENMGRILYVFEIQPKVQLIA